MSTVVDDRGRVPLRLTFSCSAFNRDAVLNKPSTSSLYLHRTMSPAGVANTASCHAPRQALHRHDELGRQIRQRPMLGWLRDELRERRAGGRQLLQQRDGSMVVAHVRRKARKQGHDGPNHVRDLPGKWHAVGDKTSDTQRSQARGGRA